MTPAELDAYLQRIGHVGACTTTVKTLAAVHRAHACTIAFENLDPWLAAPLRLDPVSLRRKLVQSGRGGYCYEHNLLLGDALRTLGFSVANLAARVLWNVPAETVRPRTHMLLVVDLEGELFVVDAGFGGMTLTAPLRLALTTPQTTPHGMFRLQRAQETWLMQADVGAAWKTLYAFDQQVQTLSDYEMTSWYLCQHPDSMFRQTLVAARPVAAGRYVLRDQHLTLHALDGGTDTRKLVSVAELRHALEGIFGIDLSALLGLDEKLARMIQMPG